MESRLNKKKTRVAIVHDVLLEYGGAERVLEELLGMFPNADLYTLYFNRTNPVIFSSFDKYSPRTSALQCVPHLHGLGKYFSITKLVSWLHFYLLDLRAYDLVISSSHSFNAKMVGGGRSALHVCYLYAPPRYLYHEQNELLFIKRFPLNFLLTPLLMFLRNIDKWSSKKPDVILASSHTVKARVKKYYDRDAVVLYPPIQIPSHKSGHTKKEYYVAHSRLVRQKGIELAVKTCTRFSLPLMVVGEGHEKKRLSKMAGPTVQFLGRVSDEEIPAIYARARALLYCAEDEDFGMVPVEAMAHGVPVVAYKSGGVKETILDGKTGVLFTDYTPDGLYHAIERLNQLSLSSGACRTQANKFNQEVFRRGFIKEIENKL